MRKAFSTSRLAEFTTEQGLASRVGLHPSWWPMAALKELVDNAIDDGEAAGDTPLVSVAVADDSIAVEDAGSGIAPEVVARIFDYDKQTSSREAYVEPTRGAQGNALQTILAMPFVLSGGGRGELSIESRGVRHDLALTADPVTAEPIVEHERSDSDVTVGTRVTVKWPTSLARNWDSVYDLAENFAALTPHLSLTLNDTAVSAPDETWAKRRPNRPPVAGWYNPATLRRLMQAFANDAEQTGDPAPTVAAFVRGFEGLKGTRKAAEIINPLGLARTTLADLLRSPDCDAEVAGLLAAMQGAAKPPKPEALGVLGRDHVADVARRYGVEDSKVEYLKRTVDADGLPHVVEVGFAYGDAGLVERKQIVGLNFSPTYFDPFRDLGDREDLDALLAEQRAGDGEPVFVLAHVASPRFEFTDKGKTTVELPFEVGNALAEMMTKATGKWRRQREAELRNPAAALARRDRFVGSDKPMTVKDAAYEVMAEAYAFAAGGVRMANPRQVMYAARGQILALTGRAKFDGHYFTQTLLPDYQRDNPTETENWDVIYDDRGHFREPHTGKEIGLGTLAVRQYLTACRKPVIEAATVVPAYASTHGPHGRFRSALFIEKEGFLPILERANIAERFDVALMSTKGMSVTASRQLIDGLAAMGVRVFVLHDFDISGFSIRKTFTESGRRHTFQNKLDFVDIGLRLDDVLRLGLASEPVALFPKPSNKPLSDRRLTSIDRLTINGATQDEIDFLMTDTDGARERVGKRVELNAMTSDQFVAFVEAKLTEHGAAKVMPDDAVLAETFAAIVRGKRAQERFTAELERLNAETVNVPSDLAARARDWLAVNPTRTWEEPWGRSRTMPLNEKVFDAQIRFVLKSELKARLYREAKRRHLSVADLIREFINDGLVKTEITARQPKLAALRRARSLASRG